MLLIYGKGSVGLGLQHLCKALGIASHLVDDADDPITRESLAQTANRIVASPGIPPSHYLYLTYGTKVYSELNWIAMIMKDYARRQRSIKIGITGTKGKSTTTRMTYHLVQSLLPTRVVHITGNFKISLGETLATIMESAQTDRQHVFVIEASSFMLYHLDELQFDYSIWTNFSPDHLNRHANLEDYFRAKACVISHTRQVCLTNEVIIRQRNSIDGQTSCLLECYQPYEGLDQTQFLGVHNALNLGACIQLVEHLLTELSIQITPAQRSDALRAIPPLAHRLQLMTHIDGIAFYDDNNSTNSASLETALKSFGQPVILICGGSDKGDSYDHLVSLFADRVTHACLIGMMSSVFARVCDQAQVSYTLCERLEPAVYEALQQAKIKKADTILFSPGCASLDQYANYYERAADLERIVNQLTHSSQK